MSICLIMQIKLTINQRNSHNTAGPMPTLWPNTLRGATFSLLRFHVEFFGFSFAQDNRAEAVPILSLQMRNRITSNRSLVVHWSPSPHEFALNFIHSTCHRSVRTHGVQAEQFGFVSTKVKRTNWTKTLNEIGQCGLIVDANYALAVLRHCRLISPMEGVTWKITPCTSTLLRLCELFQATNFPRPCVLLSHAGFFFLMKSESKRKKSKWHLKSEWHT